MNGISTISCFVQEVFPEVEGLRIQWGDNEESYFSYQWLAKNAPEFRYSQGQLGPKISRFPQTIRPRFIHLYQNNVLELGWSEFSRTTCFSTVWLREQCPSLAA